jgi:hypothetical protein
MMLNILTKLVKLINHHARPQKFLLERLLSILDFAIHMGYVFYTTIFDYRYLFTGLWSIQEKELAFFIFIYNMQQSGC